MQKENQIRFKLIYNHQTHTFLLTFLFLPYDYTHIRQDTAFYQGTLHKEITWAPTHQESRYLIALLAIVEDLNTLSIEEKQRINEALHPLMANHPEFCIDGIYFILSWVSICWLTTLMIQTLHFIPQTEHIKIILEHNKENG